MPRIHLIGERGELGGEAAELYDRIVESRGSMVRPFRVFLHAPHLARHIARLGHEVRFESALPGADRELAILAAGRRPRLRVRLGHPHRHRPPGRGPSRGSGTISTAGSRSSRRGRPPSWGWCSSWVPRPRFRKPPIRGPRRNSASTECSSSPCWWGYYTMLSYTMGAFDVCSL